MEKTKVFTSLVTLLASCSTFLFRNAVCWCEREAVITDLHAAAITERVSLQSEESVRTLECAGHRLVGRTV